MELLGTWEGLAKTAQMYHEWSGGQPFLGMNYYNDFAVITAAQLGENVLSGSGKPVYSKETAGRVWDAYYIPHIMGWYESRVYNQDGVKSGKMIAYIGSSAGAGFFPDEVIKDENKSYPVECLCLPYPVFQNGEKYMTQRGANMGVFASDEVRERAACEFLKWFTQPEQNIRFAVSTGYLPVEQEALSSVPELLRNVDDTGNAAAITSGINAYLEAGRQYAFYAKKAFDGSYELNKVFGESLEKKTAESLALMEKRILNGEKEDVVQKDLLEEDCFYRWYDSLIKEMAGMTDGEKN